MASIAEREAAVFFHTGTRLPVTLVRGQGVRVWDEAGTEYLDFVAGIAANSLGHAHPRIVATIQEQAAALIHVSNYFYTEPQLDLGEMLLRESGMHRLFFVNSGAEAMEGAIKIARKWGLSRRDGANEIIAMENGFHGRTLATVSATGAPQYSEPFGPVPGFVHVPFNDVAAVRGAVTERTAAIVVEPIQGEGGVNVPDDGYLAALRAICDEHNLLLVLDEVQTGMGRTGRLFAFQHTGITPDVMALAKGLGGGVPIGCFLANERANILEPGDHGTTFGGQPLTTAVARTVVTTMLEKDLPAQAAAKGARLMQKLRSLEDRRATIREVRGQGLLVAVEFTSEIGKAVVDAARERGLICNIVRPETVRLVPPLIVSNEEIDRAVEILDEAISAVEAG